MRVAFTKVEGLGNDFVLIDARHEPSIRDSVRPLVPKISSRKTGIGCDGVLFLMPGEEHEYLMLLTNADGSEGEMCGNGLRCIAHYLRFLGEDRSVYTIETPAGDKLVEIRPDVNGSPMYKVNMGAPIFNTALVPTTLGGERCIESPLATPNGEMKFTCLSMGNPHAVTFVKDTKSLDLTLLGPSIERHPAFPRRTNVEFARILSPSKIRARIWERGAGETSACGTGACAIAVAAAITGQAGHNVEISLPGGSLYIEWKGNGSPVFMTGTARIVFSGVFDLTTWKK